jgi:hypothetical protein
LVPAEQVAETIFTSVTLNSLSPLEDADALGADADGDAEDDEDELPAFHEPLTSTWCPTCCERSTPAAATSFTLLPLLLELALGVLLELELDADADSDDDDEDEPLPLMLVSSYVPAVVPDCTQPVSFDDFPALSDLLSIEDCDGEDG